MLRLAVILVDVVRQFLQHVLVGVPELAQEHEQKALQSLTGRAYDDEPTTRASVSRMKFFGMQNTIKQPCNLIMIYRERPGLLMHLIHQSPNLRLIDRQSPANN